jgi:ATP-dependent Lhr-like helicase
MLLDRYGIVAREMAQAEDLPGGFGPLYRVLKAMEEAGQVRRGYFVEGLSGAQFSRPGAVDRLRSARGAGDILAAPGDEAVMLLSALDPANPYGAILPWPPNPDAHDTRPRRMPGAWVVLVRGKLVLFVAAKSRHLLTFPGLLSEDRSEFRPPSGPCTGWRQPAPAACP